MSETTSPVDENAVPSVNHVLVEDTLPLTEPPVEAPPATEPPVELPVTDPPSTEPPVVEPPPIPELSPAACAARLAELFPAVFAPGSPKPLKLRIQVDVQQRAPGLFSKRALSGFLQRYTTGTAYLKALANAPERVDLDGAPAGPVSDEHRQAATAELARRRELHDARRAAEREAQRLAQREAQRVAQEEFRRAHAAREADDGARRDRAGLLRAYETTTLTRANFCALKRVAEAELDALLAQARTEREQRPPAPPALQPRPEARAGDRPRGQDRDRDDRSRGPGRAREGERRSGPGAARPPRRPSGGPKPTP